MKKILILIIILISILNPIHAAVLHVAVNGKDSNSGTKNKPLLTIQGAADLARPVPFQNSSSNIYFFFPDIF